MYFTSTKTRKNHQRVQRSILQQNVDYPEGTIKEYLNIKRTTKDKCCMAIFCFYMLAIIIMTGLGFFYGNYGTLGTVIGASGICSSPTPIINADLTGCVASCPSTQLPYIQKACISMTANPTTSSSLSAQIQIYSFSKTFPTMLYVNIVIVVCLCLFILLIICVQKLIYAYTLLSFLIMLGFSFYLLKSIEVRVDDQGALQGSVFISDQQQMNGLAFALLACYLVFFPMILFAPNKLRKAVKILSKLYKYFQTMYTLSIFTVFLVLLSYGVIFAIGFVLMNFFTGGDPSVNPASFFYQYPKVHLSNPAVLVLYFFGIFWLFGTLVSWHRYMVGSSMLQWYFQDGGKLRTVRKGIKRAWYHLGSAAIDCLLTPLEWVILAIYSVTKVQKSQNQSQLQADSDWPFCSNCVTSFHSCVNKMYCKINRTAFASGIMTNNTYIQSCQMAAVTFSENQHKFFNVGGSLTIFLTLFSTLTFIFINYIVIYQTIFITSFPSPIASMSLSILLAACLGIVEGQLLSNLFTAAIDVLLFCFLLQKKNNTDFSQNQIKKGLDDLLTNQEESQQVLEMYEIKNEDD